MAIPHNRDKKISFRVLMVPVILPTRFRPAMCCAQRDDSTPKRVVGV
jgi:hypothetical protein